MLKGTANISKKYFPKFEKGDTIFGDSAEPQELKRWSIEAKDEAEKELEKYRCEYMKMREDYQIIEYALEYSEYDEDGFVDGSDYDLAEEIAK